MRYLLAWVPMILIAIANGALREGWLVPHFGELRARQASTLILIMLFAVYMAFVFRRWPLGSARRAFAVGATWLGLMLLFEFALGWSSGLSWAQMLAEYDLAAGRLWVFVPLWVGVAPYVYYKIIPP